MCYPKPAPRCSTHARQALDRANLTNSPALKVKAQKDYDLTPAGIRELRANGSYVQADAAEKLRAELIAKSKPFVDNQTLTPVKNGNVKEHKRQVKEEALKKLMNIPEVEPDEEIEDIKEIYLGNRKPTGKPQLNRWTRLYFDAA